MNPRLLVVITYVVLFLLGGVQGVLGGFQYSRLAPFVAIVLDLLIGATCLLAAWALRTPRAAFMPALGWIVAAFVLSMPVSNGSVIIATGTAGEWFLYGGTAALALSIAASFAVTRRSAPPSV